MKNFETVKTRKDTRWKRGEVVLVDLVRKQSESEDERMRALRILRYLSLENTPEGRVVNLLSSR